MLTLCVAGDIILMAPIPAEYGAESEAYERISAQRICEFQIWKAPFPIMTSLHLHFAEAPGLRCRRIS